MGIKDLTRIIRERSPKSMKSESLYTFRDKKIAIDTSIFIYKSLSRVRCRDGYYLRNKEGMVVSHIIGLFNKTVQYLSVGIQPIYIFDGKPPVEKWECIQERQKKVQECKEKMLTETDEKEKQKLEKGTIRVTKEYINDLKQLFRLMGVSYIQSDGEAESYAGELCRMGYVDAVISEDMDTLVYECPVLIRNCLDRGNKRDDVVTTFNLPRLLKDLEMTLDQFTDMCILCGCDYCGTIPRIGVVGAPKAINKYGSIEGLIKSGKHQIPEEFLQRYPRARVLFKMYRDKLTPETIPIVSSEIQYENLTNYMVHECGMSEKRVSNALNKIKRAAKVQMPM